MNNPGGVCLVPTRGTLEYVFYTIEVLRYTDFWLNYFLNDGARFTLNRRGRLFLFCTVRFSHHPRGLLIEVIWVRQRGTLSVYSKLISALQFLVGYCSV